MKVLVFAAVLAAAVAAPDFTSSYHSAPAPKHASYSPAPKHASYSPAPKHASYNPAPKHASYSPAPKYKEEPKPYAYHYAVNDHYTGTNFAKNEQSDGHNAKGSYTVALPDGRIQTVNYVADHTDGFNAEVTYQGEAHYPEYHPAPAYKPAPYKPAPYKPAPDYPASDSVSYTSDPAHKHVLVH